MSALAQRSGSATKEIRELISRAVERVGSGAEPVERTGGSSQEARGKVARVA
ncbi:MAG: hypothetical protein WCA85_01050 [Paraburkholderia sp.]|uniref:hypothetical protein n=1 Tax=Paraburkholderia sp. TaxID=1926495 RepID=UPI003C48BF63